MRSMFVLCSLFLSSLSFATGFDGCFQMYQVGAAFPVVCIDGSAEEGIGGASARLFFFETNTDVPFHCAITSRLTLNSLGNAIALDVDGKREMTMAVTGKNSQKLRQGDVKVGKTSLKFTELNPTHTQRFLKNGYASKLCKDKTR